jgi:hypothetical protein
MSCPPHHRWFNHPNNIRWRIQAVKFIIMQFYPRSDFLPLGPNALLNTLFSKIPSLCSSPKVRDQVSHPYSTTGKITVFYILIFRFFYIRREDKRFWTKPINKNMKRPHRTTVTTSVWFTQRVWSSFVAVKQNIKMLRDVRLSWRWRFKSRSYGLWCSEVFGYQSTTRLNNP